MPATKHVKKVAPRFSGVKYVFSDMDGTILDKNKNVLPRTEKAIKSLAKAGIQFGLISGRSHLMIKPYLEQLRPSLPCVGMNGGMVFKPHEPMHFLRQTFMDDTERRMVMQHLLKNKISFVMYQPHRFIYSDASGTHPYFKWLFASRDRFPESVRWNVVDIKTVERPLDEVGMKFLVLEVDAPPGAFKQFLTFLKKLDHTYGVASGGPTIDVVPQSVSKGTGLQYLHDAGYIDLAHTLVLGDEANDIPMFKLAKYAVAMKNAGRDVKRHADAETSFDHNQDGVGLFLEELIAQK